MCRKDNESPFASRYSFQKVNSPTDSRNYLRSGWLAKSLWSLDNPGKHIPQSLILIVPIGTPVGIQFPCPHPYDAPQWEWIHRDQKYSTAPSYLARIACSLRWIVSTNGISLGRCFGWFGSGIRFWVIIDFLSLMDFEWLDPSSLQPPLLNRHTRAFHISHKFLPEIGMICST